MRTKSPQIAPPVTKMDVLDAFFGGKATTTVTNTLYTYASLLYASFRAFVPEMYTTTGLFTLLSTVFIVGVAGAHWWPSRAADSSQIKANKGDETVPSSTLDTSVLPCIRNRRSIFQASTTNRPPQTWIPRSSGLFSMQPFGALGMENAPAIRIQPNLLSLAKRAWFKCRS